MHPPRRLLRAVEDAGEVHVERAPPVGLGDLEERRAHGDAGVRDEHVDAAEQLVDARERMLDLRLVRDVAVERRLEPVDPLVRRLELALADRERDDARALGGEAAARRLADPARAAGDDDAFPLKTVHPATI